MIESDSKIKIGCVQLNTVWENKIENFKKVKKMIKEAVNQKCNVVCLPELFATGFTMNSRQFEEEIPGDTSDFIKKEAEKNKIYIVGSLIEKAEKRPLNTCIVYDKEGKMLSKYSKIHLFPLDKENEYYNEGNSISIFDIEGIKVSTFICYDLRFPEIFAIAAEKGAKIIFILANWPSCRERDWKIFLKSRALENQIYIVGVNRVGKSQTHKYFGASIIIDPLGNVIAEGSNLEEIVIANIETGKVDKIREDFPSFKDRKPKLYDYLRRSIKTFS